MKQYLDKGKEVLKILINNGCEAYMIGEAVYSLIRGSNFSKIDITTNATPDMVKGIFANALVEDEREGAVKLTYMGYTFIISTFRLEEKFKDNRKPLRLHYSKNLKDELAACDFTINAIAMSYGGKLTDAYKGYEDIKRKRVRTIGSPRVRFYEDPLRMLIAIRLVSELGFKIERKTSSAIKSRAKLLKNIEPNKMEEELRRILNGKYFKRAIAYLVDLNVYKYIVGLRKGLKHLSNNYKRISNDSILACSYVLNKQFSTTWNSLSDDPERLRRVVELALKNPRSKYDPYLLLTYGLEVCLDSNYVNYMLKKSSLKAKKIRRQYENLPIKSVADLQFTKNDYARLSTKAQQYFDVIYKDVVTKVLNKELENNFTDIKQYIIKALNVYNVNVNDIEEEKVYKPYKEYDDQVYGDYTEPEVYENKSMTEPIQVDDTPISTFEQIQRKVSEFEKSLREKDERIKELERQALENKLDSDVNSIVGQNLEILRDLNYLEKGSEKLMFSRELKEVYKGLIKSTDPKYKALNEKKEGNNTNNESED
ncbi:MAG: hypothetical protein WC006_04945 [Bacilli bacterium]|nr:hypothetical protein [Bacilli bacterium]